MLVLSGILVAGCGSTLAQSPAPADTWPTPALLRQALADDGWGWTADGSLWFGGRDTPALAMSITQPLYVSIRPVTMWGYALLSWEEQQASGWTAFMEVAERLPIDAETLRAITDQLTDGGCRDYPLPGGMLTFDARLREYGAITVAEGGEPSCDRPAPESVAPDAGESPAS
jgi:hypothetical protein